MRSLSRISSRFLCVFAVGLAACTSKPAPPVVTPANGPDPAPTAGDLPPQAETPAIPPSQSNLVAFRSFDDVRLYLKDAAATETRRQESVRRQVEERRRRELAKRDAAAPTMKGGGYSDAGPPHPAKGDAPSLAPAAAAPAPMSDAVGRSEAGQAKAANGAAATSITNNQHAGVDEGDIVKLRGKHLVVLRRGRLFSLRLENDKIVPVDRVDAFGPDIDPSGTWYDELLISDRKLVVVGFSYARGGTEVGLFDIDDAGHIKYKSTYHLKSNDYYSARNYSSRLIGDKLVFYMPTYLNARANDPIENFPAMRRWHKGAKADEFQVMGNGSTVYRPETLATMPSALHSVVTCDLAGAQPVCDVRSVLGSYSRTFYVSPSSVYVWTHEYIQPEQLYEDDEAMTPRKAEQRASLFRLPLNGGAPSRVLASGAPTDQFSFLEGADGFLNVLVRGQGNGDAMWQTEGRGGSTAMLRFPISRFSGPDIHVPKSFYTELPSVAGYTMQNRFVGDSVLYGAGNSWGYARNRVQQTNQVYTYRYKEKRPAQVLPLEHPVDRLEPMGGNALVVGGDGSNLHFTSIALGAADARIASSYVREHASQGELRSHGFFFRRDTEESGVLGLPVRGDAQPGYAHLFRDSAYVLFLKSDALKLSEFGQLGSNLNGAPQDGCRASCVDWYGNARPIFIGNRVFALLGYELVEGKVEHGRIQEFRRSSFAPPPQATRNSGPAEWE
ncbi:MAG: beta-propeller domain-containing protein [Polyangiaceae bacterium]